MIEINSPKVVIKSFLDLQVWQLAHALTVRVYEITNTWPQEEKFGITSQIRRAASSIGANIAEGFARYHFKDKVRFYHNARGSCAEVQNFIILAKDLKYTDNEICQEVLSPSNDIAKLINGLIRSIEKQNIQSPKS